MQLPPIPRRGSEVFAWAKRISQYVKESTIRSSATVKVKRYLIYDQELDGGSNALTFGDDSPGTEAIAAGTQLSLEYTETNGNAPRVRWMLRVLTGVVES